MLAATKGLPISQLQPRNTAAAIAFLSFLELQLPADLPATTFTSIHPLQVIA